MLKSPGIDREKCFITTVTYGTVMQNDVIQLQRFRDQVLLKSLLGKLFVSTYYFLSPPIAKLVSGKNFLHKVIKTIVIIPILIMTRQNPRKESE